MRPVLLALALASLFCIVAATLGLLQANPFVGQETPAWQAVFAQLVLESARYVSFAAGVTALVTMGQRRQWRWVAAMLVLVLVLTYGADVLPALPLPLPSSLLGGAQQSSLLAVLAPRYLIYPALVPLALLFYRSSPSPSPGPRPAADWPLDLEVTSLTPGETSHT
jgi:hypothetical protein